MSDLDETRLAQWLEASLPDFCGNLGLEKFAGGQSNPTYRITSPDGDLVLRRKPFGELLPSAHAVDREFRAISALHETGFPVPRPIVLCEDATVIGAAFFVMEMVEGRVFWDGVLPEIPQAARRGYYDALVDTLALLHSFDHEELGLGDFGAPGNYFERQVRRWVKQYRAAQTDDIPEIEKLIEWLPGAIPEQGRTCIIHGDYRIDNLIYAPDAAEVRAVLDWELATIGDPLADFTYLAMNWILPYEGGAPLDGLDLDLEAIPALDDVVARYCMATGRDELPNLHWYFAYNIFRYLSILQGVKRRMADGNASSTNAAAMVARIEPLAKAGWAEASRAGASNT